MIGLMATLVPGLLARAARRAGRVPSLGSGESRPGHRVVRSLGSSLLGAAAGVGGSAALLGTARIESLDWLAGLLAKLAFGAALAALATPASLRAELTPR